MAKKKAKKKAPTGGRPANWQEICMARVAGEEPPEPVFGQKEAEKAPEE